MKLNVAASLLLAIASSASADVVLNKKIMQLSRTAAKLSKLAYEEDPHPSAYKNFGFYDEEPDQALVAKKNGYCFGAFRGTSLTMSDWSQNIDPRKEPICDDDGVCCTTRQGFYNAYMTHYRDDMEKAIRDCANDCLNPDECVVLTGHSQGGAIAAVSAFFLADLNPYVITFGQPLTLNAPCDKLTSERIIRYVNTKESDLTGIAYDPVPFLPDPSADSFGHMVLLSEDNTGVAYIGLDAQDYFGPLNVAGFEAHSMVAENGTDHPGYLDRIEALMANNTYPIRNNGYVAGSLCSEDKECMSKNCEHETHFSWNRCVGTQCEKDEDCPKTGRCDSGMCIPKLGSCQHCDEDSDCESDRCLLFSCAGPSGKMDDNCRCKWDSDCESGRCEGLAPPQCEATLAVGSHCNEHSDCKSGYCSWSFKCAEKKKKKKRTRSINPEEEKEEDDDVAVVDDDYVAPSSGSHRRRRIIVSSVVVVVGIIVASFAGRECMRRRQGYEEIPTSMNV